MELGGSKSSNEPAVLYFDEDGDTRLSLTRCDPERTYVVSSKAMSLVCPAWRSMLSRNNGFREATLVESNRAIPLPDDDPEALELLLNIAHMRFEHIPKTLTFDELLFVADLTEKYGAVKILRPWLKGIEHLVEESGYEEWLFIAWAFGEEEIFTRLSTRLVREVFTTRDGQCLTTNARVLDPSSDDCLFPPGIIEKILEHRLRAIDKMLNSCYAHLGEFMDVHSDYRTKYGCKYGDTYLGSGPEVGEACEALTFGSFVRALHKLDLQEVGLRFERKTAKDIMGSFEMLREGFQTIDIPNLGKTPPASDGPGHCNHSYCASELIRNLKDIPSLAEHLLNPVDESHRSHMEQRRRELRQTVQSDLENPDQRCSNPRKRRRQ